jgi:hypothetical protein
MRGLGENRRARTPGAIGGSQACRGPTEGGPPRTTGSWGALGEGSGPRGAVSVYPTKPVGPSTWALGCSGDPSVARRARPLGVGLASNGRPSVSPPRDTLPTNGLHQATPAGQATLEAQAYTAKLFLFTVHGLVTRLTFATVRLPGQEGPHISVTRAGLSHMSVTRPEGPLKWSRASAPVAVARAST